MKDLTRQQIGEKEQTFHVNCPRMRINGFLKNGRNQPYYLHDLNYRG